MDFGKDVVCLNADALVNFMPHPPTTREGGGIQGI